MSDGEVLCDLLEKEKRNSFLLADYNWDCTNDDDGSFFYRDPRTECVVFVYENAEHRDNVMHMYEHQYHCSRPLHRVWMKEISLNLASSCACCCDVFSGIHHPIDDYWR